MQPTRCPFRCAFKSTIAFCTVLALAVSVLPVRHAQASEDEIIVTLPPLAGIVHLLAPEIKVTCLLTQGADPHGMELTPKMVERIRHARLLIRTSADDGSWRGWPKGLHILDLWPQKDHAWLVPEEVAAAIKRIANALVELRFIQTSEVSGRLHEAQNHIERVRHLLSTQLKPLRTDGVILQHPAWARLCHAYSVPVWAVLERNHHSHGLHPWTLEKALKALRQHPRARLWGDKHHNNRALLWIAERHPGASIRMLDPLGDCDLSWEALLERNLAKMVP